eukprot:GHVP01008097.1.p1 GENE.GHVP01008097.1~~GHVP01008097.1.p1  ORF type:complete len:568 (+),score=115.92 GHVP01008097.1:10-1713(+)
MRLYEVSPSHQATRSCRPPNFQQNQQINQNSSSPRLPSFQHPISQMRLPPVVPIMGPSGQMLPHLGPLMFRPPHNGRNFVPPEPGFVGNGFGYLPPRRERAYQFFPRQRKPPGSRGVPQLGQKNQAGWDFVEMKKEAEIEMVDNVEKLEERTENVREERMEVEKEQVEEQQVIETKVENLENKENLEIKEDKEIEPNMDQEYAEEAEEEEQEDSNDENFKPRNRSSMRNKNKRKSRQTRTSERIMTNKKEKGPIQTKEAIVEDSVEDNMEDNEEDYIEDNMKDNEEDNSQTPSGSIENIFSEEVAITRGIALQLPVGRYCGARLQFSKMKGEYRVRFLLDGKRREKSFSVRCWGDQKAKILGVLLLEYSEALCRVSSQEGTLEALKCTIIRPKNVLKDYKLKGSSDPSLNSSITKGQSLDSNSKQKSLEVNENSEPQNRRGRRSEHKRILEPQDHQIAKKPKPQLLFGQENSPYNSYAPLRHSLVSQYSAIFIPQAYLDVLRTAASVDYLPEEPSTDVYGIQFDRNLPAWKIWWNEINQKCACTFFIPVRKMKLTYYAMCLYVHDVT